MKTENNKIIVSTIMDIIFIDLLILYQIFFSSQVKRSVIIGNKPSVIISNKPQELPNNLRRSILGN